MPKLAVQSEDLREQSDAVRSGAVDVHDTLSRLSAQIADLASRWEGGASQAFQDRWDDWKRGAQQVQEAMDAMGAFLNKAAETYEATEDSLKSAAGS